MFRPVRFALITAALAVSAMAADPAHAQQASGPLRHGIATATFDDVAPSFLVKGIATNAAAGQQSSSGNPRHEGIGIGAEVGPIFSSFDGLDQDLNGNTGFEGGIFFGGNRPGLIGVMGKVLYAVKGASDDFDNELKIKYLEIPVLARVNVGSGSLNGVSVYGVVGPVFDVKLSADFNGDDVSDDYEGLDIGIQFGGGIEITRFLVEAVYTKGLRAVNNGDLGDTEEIKSHSFAILFGVRFN